VTYRALGQSRVCLVSHSISSRKTKNVSTGGTHKSWFATSVGTPRWEEKKEDEATIVDRAASGDEKGRTDRAASCDEKKTMKAPESSHGHEHGHGKQSADHVGDDRSREVGNRSLYDGSQCDESGETDSQSQELRLRGCRLILHSHSSSHRAVLLVVVSVAADCRCSPRSYIPHFTAMWTLRTLPLSPAFL